MTAKEYLLSLGFGEKKVDQITKKISIKEAEEVDAKLNGYQNLLGATRSEVVKMAKLVPAMLSYDIDSESPTSVKNKIVNYSKIFDILPEKVIRMVKNYPALLCLDTISESKTSVKGKIKAYSKILSLDEEEVLSIIKMCPTLLDYGVQEEQSNVIYDKVMTFQEILGVDKSDVVKMIMRNPSLLCMDTISEKPSSMKSKIKNLLKFVPVQKIIENPTLLNCPPNRLKLRYLLLSDLHEDVFSTRYLMMSEQVSFARRCYLQERGIKPTVGKICASKMDFERLYGEVDVARYPITPEVVAKIEEAYKNRTGEEMLLNEAEKRATIENYEQF